MDSSAFSKGGDYSPAEGNANWAAINALKTALASSMVGLSTSNIEITGVTSGARRRLSSAAGNRTPPSGPRLLSSTCTVSYTVTFATTDLGYTDAGAAYVVLTNALQKSLSSGSFATTLSLAAELYNAGVLASFTLSVVCVSDDPNYCSLVSEPAFVLVTKAPTHQPTFRPTGAFSNEALSSWTPYKTSLVAGIGGFLMLFIPCMMYIFRHQLPFVHYKRREAVEKQRARLEKRAALADKQGFARAQAPSLKTLDDLIGANGGEYGSSSDVDSRSSFSSGVSGSRRLRASLSASASKPPPVVTAVAVLTQR